MLIQWKEITGYDSKEYSVLISEVPEWKVVGYISQWEKNMWHNNLLICVLLPVKLASMFDFEFTVSCTTCYDMIDKIRKTLLND